jgi:hypothetical protein
MNIDSISIKGLEVHDNRIIYKNNEILFDNIESITFYAIERETSVVFVTVNTELKSYLVINELNKNERIKIKSESSFFNRRDTEKRTTEELNLISNFIQDVTFDQRLAKFNEDSDSKIAFVYDSLNYESPKERSDKYIFYKDGEVTENGNLYFNFKDVIKMEMEYKTILFNLKKSNVKVAGLNIPMGQSMKQIDICHDNDIFLRMFEKHFRKYF